MSIDLTPDSNGRLFIRDGAIRIWCLPLLVLTIVNLVFVKQRAAHCFQMSPIGFSARAHGTKAADRFREHHVSGGSPKGGDPAQPGL